MADRAISPPELTAAAPLEYSRRQLEALLEVAESIAQHRDLAALFHDLAERLHCCRGTSISSRLCFMTPSATSCACTFLETRLPTPAKTGSETPMDGHPSGWVWQSQQPFVVSDTEEDHRFPDFLARLREVGVRSLAMVPLTTAQPLLGAMGFGRLVPQGITEAEVQFMQRAASQVAVAVDNALNYPDLPGLSRFSLPVSAIGSRSCSGREQRARVHSRAPLEAFPPGIVTSSLEKVIHQRITPASLFAILFPGS